jgi:spore maturation protein CgeB
MAYIPKDLNDFLRELAKPRSERKYIDKNAYKRFRRLYRLSPDVQKEINYERQLNKKFLNAYKYRKGL